MENYLSDALLCQQAYTNEATILANEFGIIFDEKTNTIAFRGTDPSLIQNWLTDIDSIPIKHKDYPGLVHEGFAKARSEEHTSELQSHSDIVCRLLLEKKK